MNFNLSKFFRKYYNKITQSIAFYPALIAVGFLVLSWFMIEIDFSTFGKQLKSGSRWLTLKDADTARSIISTVAGAIISLTVFSFSMVMIVLNQAASHMSNRVLSSMIGNRFQQMVLGFYIGTIVYALFLLSTIREIDRGIYVPALSIYLLILLTVVDIFLFIYFLNYVTQTVKYETIISRLQRRTINSMTKKFNNEQQVTDVVKNDRYVELHAGDTNYFQSINRQKLLEIAKRENIFIELLHKPSSFVTKGTPVLRIHCEEKPGDKPCKEILSCIDLYSGQSIDVNPDYGFIQLAEIAIKALSPGINDPNTAVIAINALLHLFQYKLNNTIPELITDDSSIARVHLPVSTFEDLFEKCIFPIWNYGRNDQYIQTALTDMLTQLKRLDTQHRHTALFNKLQQKITIELRKSDIHTS